MPVGRWVRNALVWVVAIAMIAGGGWLVKHYYDAYHAKYDPMLAAFEQEVRGAGYYVPRGEASIDDDVMKVSIGGCAERPRAFAPVENPHYIQLRIPGSALVYATRRLATTPPSYLNEDQRYPWATDHCLERAPS